VLLVSCELLLQTSLSKLKTRSIRTYAPRCSGGKSGQIAHIESVYNDIFVIKDASILKIAFQWNGWPPSRIAGESCRPRRSADAVSPRR